MVQHLCIVQYVLESECIPAHQLVFAGILNALFSYNQVNQYTRKINSIYHAGWLLREESQYILCSVIFTICRVVPNML